MGPSPVPPDATELPAAVYQALRGLAAAQLARERDGHTLQPTALAHEAWIRLDRLEAARWSDERAFLVAAAGTIRRVLVDHARLRAADKRGGGARRLTLAGLPPAAEVAPEHPTDVDLLDLEQALAALAERDARKARVVELRYFAGLTIAETARALAVSTTTVEDDWTFARSWLRRRLGERP